MNSHGFSDSIHHALAFCAKHHPGPVSRHDAHNSLLSISNLAIILARHQADESTIVAAVLTQLLDATPQLRLVALHQNIARRFGGLVAVAVDAAAEPRFDPMGRERSWHACRAEALARLASASGRVCDIWMGSEIHVVGMALTDIRRLGVEYARSVAPAPARDLLWWHEQFVDLMTRRGGDARASLLAELRHYTGAVAQYLAPPG